MNGQIKQWGKTSGITPGATTTVDLFVAYSGATYICNIQMGALFTTAFTSIYSTYFGIKMSSGNYDQTAYWSCEGY